MLNGGSIWETMLLLLPVALPLLGSLLVLGAKRYGNQARNNLVLLTAALTVLAVGAAYPLVMQGPLRSSMKILGELDLILRMDHLSFTLAMLVSLIWLLVALFSIPFFASTHAGTRFYVFFLSTLGHVMGVFLAGDLLSFFLFFELMTFSSFVLFVHYQTGRALQAGIIYIFMGVVGGLSLLMGIFLVYHSTGTLEMTLILEGLMESGSNLPLIILLFLVGFGIKMGMVPLHIWMPLTYESAPSPVNALSSAAMIKAGAYGLIRIMLPAISAGGTSPAGGGPLSLVGHYVIWAGIITMLSGALMALLQDDSHRILACSSISQMGYVLLGIGSAAYLGLEGAMGYAGTVYHMINHACIKGALFLVVGALSMGGGQRVSPGGRNRKPFFIMTIFVLAALGIGGIPGLNGYISKTLLHHALVKAYQLQYDPGLWLAEKLFVLASALTLCYFIRLFFKLFSTERKPGTVEGEGIPRTAGIALAVFALIFPMVGLFPNLVYEGLILPSLGSFAFDPANIMNYLEGINFFAGADLAAAAQAVVLAAVFVGLAYRFKGLAFTPPAWMSVENRVYRPLVRLAYTIACKGGAFFDGRLNHLYDDMGRTSLDACKYVGLVDRTLEYSRDEEGRIQAAAGADCPLEEGEENGKKEGRKGRGRFQWKPEEFHIRNLNFDSLLMAFVLGVLFFVLLFYARGL